MRWDQQVTAINKVQRLPDGVESDFYRMQGGKPSFNPMIAFPNQATELLVAMLKLTLVGTPHRLSVQIWAVDGYIFSIEYTGGSKYFEEAMSMDPPARMDIQCELVADLAEPTR